MQDLEYKKVQLNFMKNGHIVRKVEKFNIFLYSKSNSRMIKQKDQKNLKSGIQMTKTVTYFQICIEYVILLCIVIDFNTISDVKFSEPLPLKSNNNKWDHLSSYF